jgi:hypothetical protein
MYQLKLLALVIACGMTFHVSAQRAPREVTDFQMADYKSVANAACRDGGRQKGDPEAQVDAFCACLMEHLNKSMTRAEWQQVYFSSQNQKGDEERQVLAPYLKSFKGCSPPP